MPAENVDFSTEVSAITYSVRYEMEGGSVNVVYPAIYDIDHLTLPLKNPTKDGYNFI
jgi:hypothetical protein